MFEVEIYIIFYKDAGINFLHALHGDNIFKMFIRTDDWKKNMRAD